MDRLAAIKEVFAEFDKQDVKYCLLRNYEGLLGGEESIEGLDTVVGQGDFSKVDGILNQLGFTMRDQQFSRKHKAYFKLVNLKKVSFDIQVGGVYWNDMQYLGEKILQNRVRNSFFFVPSDNDTFVMLLVHSILGKRYFKQKYQNILCSLDIDEESVGNDLARIFSRRIASTLIKSVKDRTFSKIKSYSLVAYFILKQPQRVFRQSVVFMRWLSWKKFLAAYPLISIIGPDGAGKSTMVEGLESFLTRNNRRVAVIYTGRGKKQLLPLKKVGMAYKRREIQRDKKTKPKILRRRLLYTAMAPTFTLDLLLRYLFRIMPTRRKRTTVITDRYCSDIMLMKHVPVSMKRFLLRIFPRPTMTFYLYNSPEVLHERRPEESITELQRQLKLFNELKKYLRPVQISTDNEKENNNYVQEMVLTKLLQEWY